MVNVCINNPPVENVCINNPLVEVEICNIVIGAIEGEHYQGSYYVVPTAEGFVLETAEKIMDENLNVLPIPYAEVDNPQGGITATIG